MSTKQASIYNDRAAAQLAEDMRAKGLGTYDAYPPQNTSDLPSSNNHDSSAKYHYQTHARSVQRGQDVLAVARSGFNFSFPLKTSPPCSSPSYNSSPKQDKETTSTPLTAGLAELARSAEIKDPEIRAERIGLKNANHALRMVEDGLRGELAGLGVGVDVNEELRVVGKWLESRVGVLREMVRGEGDKVEAKREGRLDVEGAAEEEL